MNFKSFTPPKAPTSKASRLWQDKDNPYSIPNILKRYDIKPPTSFRIWALAKKNAGFIETTTKALEDGLKRDHKEMAGVLISKLLPKKK